jgi:hypothetical protein
MNGVSGFGPVPRSTIAVEEKGQIRDWPKKAPYHTEDVILLVYTFLNCLHEQPRAVHTLGCFCSPIENQCDLLGWLQFTQISKSDALAISLSLTVHTI